MRMQKPKSFFRIFTETGPLIALSVAVALLVGIAGPASAQFFNFGGWSRPQPRSSGGGGGWFGGDLFTPFQQQQQQAPKRVENFSKAPPPEKRDTVPERNVLVLGDAMADWLAYGLEDAYAEQPDIGVIRRHKTVSGLIRYQPKGEPADWAAAAKGILATEKPDAIVVMLGLDDRAPIRDSGADKSDKNSRGQGRHHLCRRLGRLCGRSGALPAAGARLRRSNPPPAVLRRRVFHQARRAQARPLCRARDHEAVGCAFYADRAAERTGDTGCERGTRSASAAPTRRPSPAAGCLVGWHRSITRRPRLTPCGGRCAGRAYLGKGRAACSARRPRRRFRLASP